MPPSKIPPRATRSSASKPSRSDQAGRKVVEEEVVAPKKSSPVEKMGALDYLIEYKELVLLFVVLIGLYGTYAYFQPYFAAEEAKKQRPVIGSEVPTNTGSLSEGGSLRETPATAYRPPSQMSSPTLPVTNTTPTPPSQPTVKPLAEATYPQRKMEYLQPTPTPAPANANGTVTAGAATTPNTTPAERPKDKIEPGKIRRPGF